MIAPDPFRLQGHEIEQLDAAAFADLLNRLLEAEADRNGLPQEAVETTEKITAKDAGIDARVRGRPTEWSKWLPSGLVAVQYKSGGIDPAELREEFQKGGVQEVVRQGGSYVVLLGRDYEDPQRQRRIQALMEEFQALGLQPRSRFWTATDIARWASEVTGLLLLRYFRRPIGELVRFEDWAGQRQHQLPFEPDELRRRVVEGIQQSLRQDSGPLHIRLEGLPGVGKTRVTMESLRQPGLRERVWYAQTPEDIPDGLFQWMAANAPASLVLVVDECFRGNAERLGVKAETSRGRLRLITIGPLEEGTAAPPMGFYAIERLGDKELEAVVKTAAPSLHPEAIRFILKMSEGYVKLATAIAAAIAKNPSLATARGLTEVYQVRSVLDALLPDRRARRGMQALALLQRVGIEGEPAAEGQVVAEFLGMTWQDLQEVDAQMRSRGLVVRRGRYRYVTPHLLAIWLAAEALDAHGNDLMDLLQRLPAPETKRAFFQRLADLGGHEYAQEVAERLLAPGGPFTDLLALDDEAGSEMLGLLAKVSPDAAIRTMQRLLANRSTEELGEFSRGRRHVVWTLERLAWLPGTFRESALLLLALAEAENESYGNNATGVWVGLFRTHLGGTAVPAIERHRLLEEVLRSDRPTRRVLAVRALEVALTIYETRTGGAEDHGGRVVPPEWRPTTIEEDFLVRRSALRLLESALQDSDQSVSRVARQVFLRIKRNALQFGLGDEIVRLLEQLPIQSDDARREIRVAAEELLHYHSKQMLPSVRQGLEALQNSLTGRSFRERMQRWVGPWSIHDHAQDRGGRPAAAEEAARLAEEAFADSSLIQEELDWLASPAAENVLWFARRLGELDTERRWLDPIFQQVRNGQGSTLFASYLEGRAQAGEEAWREEFLDRLAQAEPTVASAILEATCRPGGGTRGAYRLVKLVRQGSLKPADLGLLVWGGWVKELDQEAFSALLKAAMQDEGPSATGVALTLLDTWLDEHPEGREALATQAWALIERASGPLSPNMIQYHWEEVAARYLADNPLRLARAILAAYRASDVVIHRDEGPVRLLTEATRQARDEVWQDVGAALLGGDNFGLRLLLGLEGWYGDVVGVDVLLQWTREREADAQWIAARVASVKGDPLPQPARRLLIEYGDQESVRTALYANVVSGGWSGPGSIHYAKVQKAARAWLKDPAPQVREWAEGVVRGIQEHVEMYKRWEEERGW